MIEEAAKVVVITAGITTVAVNVTKLVDWFKNRNK